jgi:hypothetical protein
LKSDVLRIELELSKRKMTLVTIENDILIATQKLNIILGIPDDQIVIPDVPFNQWNENTTYADYLKQALDHSFDYHVSEQQTELSMIKLKQVKANVRPKIGMYGEFYYANPQIFLYPYNPYWYSLGIVGIKASFSISSLYHNTQKVKAAALEFEKEEEVHKDTEDKIRQQVKEAYLRYQEALEQIKVAETNVAQAKENARIIKNTYFSQTSLLQNFWMLIYSFFRQNLNWKLQRSWHKTIIIYYKISQAFYKTMKKKYTPTDRLITKITGWISVFIVAALIVWGGFTLKSYYKYEQTNDAQIQEYVNPVISRAGGFIVAVKFEENQEVKKEILFY